MDRQQGPRKWISRRQAAAVLNTSYENVKRLQKIGLLHSKLAGDGCHVFDRAEVEELARRRAKTRFNTPSGELTARVFRMFKEGKSFADIVVDTDQTGDTILRLWEQYTLGFQLARPHRRNRDAGDLLDEHQQQILEMDRELERRRREARGDGPTSCRGDPPGSDSDS